jgi:hypothetical protein
MIRRKIFYTPGLISLLGLSVALLLYLNSKHVFDKFNVLMVNWDYFDPFQRADHKKHFFESLHSKHTQILYWMIMLRITQSNSGLHN